MFTKIGMEYVTLLNVSPLPRARKRMQDGALFCHIGEEEEEEYMTSRVCCHTRREVVFSVCARRYFSDAR